MSEPLVAGDLLLDPLNDEVLLLLRESEMENDGEVFETWDFWNLTRDTRSWWYAAALEDELDFRRL